MKVSVKDITGKDAGEHEVKFAVIENAIGTQAVHDYVTAYRAGLRLGTHKTKRRGEVSGGGIKPYKQKGTGRARQGSIRAPHYTGGGVVHGPQPREYDQRTPKKMKAAALRGALSDRARNGRVHIVQSLVSGSVPSTKEASAALRSLRPRMRRSPCPRSASRRHSATARFRRRFSRSRPSGSWT